MKTCPFCAEEVRDEAIKCKHCHSMIGDFDGDGPPVRGVATNKASIQLDRRWG